MIEHSSLIANQSNERHPQRFTIVRRADGKVYKSQKKTQGVQNIEHLALYKAYRFVIYYVKPYRKSEKSMPKSASPSNIGK